MKTDKLNRFLPSANMRFIDNGFIVTIIDPQNGQVAEEKVYEDFVEGLKAYKKTTETVGNQLEEARKKIKENPKEKEKEEVEKDELE